jgi:hypothetical protein
MSGIIGASVVAGRVITRTGRYKQFPISGMAIAAVGLFLLSTMQADTGRLVSGAYMLVLGIGIGCVMQVLVLVIQNAVRTGDLGVATSTVSFFRSVGGSVGVALFGAVFNARLTAELARTVPEATGGDFDPTAIRPEAIDALPAAVRGDVVTVFASALTDVFLLAVPLVLLGFGLTWLLREIPLRTSTAPGAAEVDRSVAAAVPTQAAPLAAGGSVPVPRPMAGGMVEDAAAR